MMNNDSAITCEETLCEKIDLNDDDSWEAIDRAMTCREGMPLFQAWRETPEEGLKPATVWTAQDAEGLMVYAKLDDEHIFNPEVAFNKPSFICGDVFEIFLRPAQQEAYYEIHVNPNNTRFQLRIPTSDDFYASRGIPGIPPHWFVGNWQIESRVMIDQENQQWQVFAKVPFRFIEEQNPGTPRVWHASFSRYDYSHGFEQPVISSTSPHKEADFHRQAEWGTLIFS